MTPDRRRGNQAWSGVLVAVVLAALTAALVQKRWMLREKIPGPLRPDRLVTMLIEARDENKKLWGQLEALRAEMASYRRLATRGQALAKKLAEELERVRILAGLTPVKGPGIIARVEDAPPSAIPAGADRQAFVVHDEDLLKIVNELRAAGAEAISVNGQRIVATSEIRCSGPVIRVNNVSVGSPYEIRAIGDPEALKSALTISGGVLDLLKQFNIRVKIIESKEVVVPGLASPPAFKFARPIKPEEAEKAAEAASGRR